MLKILVVLLGMNAAIVFSQAYTWMPLGSASNNGINDTAYAITSFNGKVIYGGNFSVAGGVNVNNIAAYDPVTNSWSALGNGINGEVKALIVFNNQLYAGGQFSSPGNNIARWNGTTWLSVGSGTDGEVLAFTLYNSDLAVGGNFDHAGGKVVNNIASWDGSLWDNFGSGLTGSGDRVNALTIFLGGLVAGGRFDAGSANNVAWWNGISWMPFNSNNFEDEVNALAVFNTQLFAGGKFEDVGGINNTKYIARWNGIIWGSVGGGLEDGDVEALTVYRNSLIVGGNFRITGSNLYVDRIAAWTGSQWQRMLTGMNDRINGLYANAADTVLYSAGEFTSAGGKWSNFSARWGLFNTISVSGVVRHEGTLIPVTGGKVKAVRYDVVTREVVVVDSANINGTGNYIIQRIPRNEPDVRILAFPDDEDATSDTSFVPTYYPSVLEWKNANVLNLSTNLTNINIIVKNRKPAPGLDPSLLGISGNVFLNILPPPVGVITVPYWKNSLIYFEQNNEYITFTQTNEAHQYNLSLNPGTYTMTVIRLGYETETRQVILTNQNLTENFYLDTFNVIGITNINSEIPKEFLLRQNYPNPFNPVTNIEFSIPRQDFVKISVYDILGKEIGILVNENLNAGTYKVDFDASQMPSGVYFYRIQTTDFTESKKMVLLK